MARASATKIMDEAGRMYHIGLKTGDLAEFILLVGDPKRVERVTKKFSKVRFQSQHREFVCATGFYNDLEISVLGTGIGQDNTEIAVIEACQITQNPTFLRCGTTGSLVKDVEIGDLIITTASVRLEGTTKYFVADGFPAVADLEASYALACSAHADKQTFHLGLTASAAGFYGAQGRSLEGFPVRFPNLSDELAQQGILNMEMETATLFVLSSLRKIRSGSVCAVVAHRPTDKFADEKTQIQAEQACIDVSLNAFHLLVKMDQQKKKQGTPIWIPTL